MSEIHTNNKPERNLEIPSRNDLRNKSDDNDEKSQCFGHLHLIGAKRISIQRKPKGFFKKILYRFAECIEIHVEVNFQDFWSSFNFWSPIIMTK